MADTTTETVKVCPVSTDNTALWASLMNQQNNPAEMIAMMNSQSSWNNNPFVWLIWLAFFGGGNGLWGNRADAAQTTAENYNSRAIATLQDTINNNHSNDLALQAINGNRDALGQLAQTFNADINAITAAVANVKSAIDQVSGQVGYSSESVKNAIALGDSNIMSKMQDCCCQTKTAILEQGYQNQLATERQTGIITSQMSAQHAADQLLDTQNHASTISRIDQLANGITQGFAQVGYATAQQTAEIVNASNANTQKVLDALCNQSTQALRDELAERDRQLQTQTIINQLKSSGCLCNS